MKTKPFYLMFAGMILGAVLNCGIFDEAAQVHEAKVAWCAGTCK